MISVIIPLYNKEDLIKSTIESALNQTYTNYEIIIINDGSTDNSLEIIKEINDKRIRVISQENQGVSVARNNGIQQAKGDLIAFLDADDVWDKTFLETIAGLIDKYPECSVFATSYTMQRYDGIIKEIILNRIPFSGDHGVLTNYFEVASYSHPPIWTSAVAVKRESIVSIKGFPTGIKAGEDLLAWARLAIKYKIAYDINPKACFILGKQHSYDLAPSRIPPEQDIVGKNLELLYKENKKIIGLRKYIALWYKMRASMLLLLGQKKRCFYECCKSIGYNPLNYVVWAYLILLLFPQSIRYSIFQKAGNQ
jgi:glycosyltransferase involved in cell wall biosynthesis